MELHRVILPIAARFSVAWSVCLSSCRSHLCTLLKSFNGFRCSLAGTYICGFSNALCQI